MDNSEGLTKIGKTGITKTADIHAWAQFDADFGLQV